MAGKIPQFKVRKINGVTELRLRDDRELMRELASAFKDFSVFLDEGQGEPTFMELKGCLAATEFARCFLGALRFELSIRHDSAGALVSKEASLVDESGKGRAVCKWAPGKEMTIEIMPEPPDGRAAGGSR